ncbi:MAG: 30S ribosomal protein S7 [Planctomycetes bacterium]|nr:30S ribosomal protein S7 [Planctomycetota bacterium]MBM4078380.1 30S ribosomal protein S7 [Planctomycetota bacterium]MBM4083162.1 30S ribosomal protein S7 [Planctomycetota bacterium]
MKYRSTEVFIKPDVRYKSKLVTKFINRLMYEGKKSTAERSFYKAMDIVEEKVKGVEPLQFFETAIENVKPVVEVRSKRVGGATYQVPMEVKPNRRISLAFRWILEAARAKKGKPMHQRLADELTDAYNKTGAAVTQRDNVHKMAEANKAFAHFAW